MAMVEPGGGFGGEPIASHEVAGHERRAGARSWHLSAMDATAGANVARMATGLPMVSAASSITSFGFSAGTGSV